MSEYTQLAKELHQAAEEYDRGHGPLHAAAANAILHQETLIADLRIAVERMKGALCMIVGLGGRHDLIDAQKFASSALSSTGLPHE